MKIIYLNTWGGKFFDLLIKFIDQNKDADIFCLQEIYDTTSDVKQYRDLIRANLLQEIKNVLVGFSYNFLPTLYGFDELADPVDFDLKYGIAIFIKNSIKVNSYKFQFINSSGAANTVDRKFSDLPTAIQYIDFEAKSKEFCIFNFHGTPYPGDKLDAPQRVKQSQEVLRIVSSEMGAKILGGDFNLLPNTQSIHVLEEKMRNLVKEFNIGRTRSSRSPYYGKIDFQKFADYTFVTENILVEDFIVPDIDISDHLPMILQFS